MLNLTRLSLVVLTFLIISISTQDEVKLTLGGEANGKNITALNIKYVNRQYKSSEGKNDELVEFQDIIHKYHFRVANAKCEEKQLITKPDPLADGKLTIANDEYSWENVPKEVNLNDMNADDISNYQFSYDLFTNNGNNKLLLSVNCLKN